jgi:hypothetical protein
VNSWTKDLGMDGVHKETEIWSRLGQKKRILLNLGVPTYW